MGLFTKLFTALRGAGTEIGEAIVDSQAIRIMDQEMRDARDHLDAAKENLAKVMAEQIGVEREVSRLKKKVAEYENYAQQALDKGDERLATEIAEKIAELENELLAQEKILESYNNNVNMLKQTIKNTERNIQAMERQVSVVKTTESVQKASAAAANKFSGTNSTLRTASESLERIKQKQQQQSDLMQAAMQLQQEESGDGLQAKLKQAGILTDDGATGNDVLARLKAKRNPL